MPYMGAIPLVCASILSVHSFLWKTPLILLWGPGRQIHPGMRGPETFVVNHFAKTAVRGLMRAGRISGENVLYPKNIDGIDSTSDIQSGATG
jgi:hypothetical protein